MAEEDKAEVDEFVEADRDAGVEVLPAERPSSAVARDQDVMAFRAGLVAKYHEGAPSLVERLRKAGKEDMESLLLSLIDEVVTETDHLLGNELIATTNGELRDASVISYKRAEVLEKAIKAVQAKHEAEKVNGLDVDSSEMMTVFRFFLSKAKDAMERMGVEQEVSDLFFRTLGDLTENWKKELKEHFESTRLPRGA